MSGVFRITTNQTTEATGTGVLLTGTSGAGSTAAKRGADGCAVENSTMSRGYTFVGVNQQRSEHRTSRLKRQVNSSGKNRNKPCRSSILPGSDPGNVRDRY